MASVGTEDPCRPGHHKAPFWTTQTGCHEVTEDPYRPEGSKIPVYYELSIPKGRSWGSILVFHGGPGYPRKHLNQTGTLWKGLRAHFHVLYFHQRGSGFSGLLRSSADLEGKESLYSLDTFVEDAYVLARSLLPDSQYILFGKSAGGFLALKFALRHPRETKSLILAATSAYHGYLSKRATVEEQFFVQLEQRHRGFGHQREEAVARLEAEAGRSPDWHRLFGSLASDLLESVALDLSYTLEGQFELVALVSDCSRGDCSLLLRRVNQGKRTLGLTGVESVDVLRHVSCRELMFGRSAPESCVGIEEGTPYDIRKRLPEIHVPVLVLSGRHDPVLPSEFQEEIALGISGPVEWRVMELSGHMLFSEQPGLSSRVVLLFLDIEIQQPAQDSSL